eukprot:scaffold28862_cov33-Phaeocystis_antarctica.AAC.2
MARVRVKAMSPGWWWRWLGLGSGQCDLRGGGDGDEGGDVITLEEALTNLEGSGDLLHGEMG